MKGATSVLLGVKGLKWLHLSLPERRLKKLEHEPADPKTLARLARLRKQEKEMHGIMKELAVYAVFVYVLLTLTYNHTDSNAWLLRENLRHSLVHEGLTDGSDFTKVSTRCSVETISVETIKTIETIETTSLGNIQSTTFSRN